ncbi:TlpA family protein disulfide reductase [Neotamlana laminarinivorans]|uniref:TlpA family protein disulfide reductase n=1 Tax=Neotamlana laminarinivorans TaxID=2883124 RepID=A0A9X1HYQ7_9FLAO|nr:TlpA disulfide reductase family protein [Tamlana laminarinivorans]MCB4797750.1 TlpA family protein disulfide reductase [Tamlana laminarinivorans]
MKKLLLLSVAIAAMACKQEPKDYVTLSGKITNKNSDSLLVRSRTYSKTIQVNENGTFTDTLKVEPGVYNFFDGVESTSIFLKNGFDLDITLDTKEFDESITFEGSGAEHSSFLAKHNLMVEEFLDIDKLSALNMEELDGELNNVKTKFSTFYDTNKNIDTLITKQLTASLDPMLNSYKRYLAQGIALKTALPKGSPSPTFEDYENFNGGTTSLEDLKGKYVYIDVWATWCGPCKVEIPSLKALEKEYEDKNIQFVSLSVDDGRGYRGESKEESAELAKEGWKKMIAEKELGGIQVLSPNGWQSDFIQNYRISGIPRFILIDPNGNIVSADAPRPSSAAIKTLFNELNI